MPVLTFMGGPSNDPIINTTTLTSANWSNSTYTITGLAGVTATSTQVILPTTTMTQAQYEAFAAAEVIDNGQSTGSITITALGTVPTIDIPIRIMVLPF